MLSLSLIPTPCLMITRYVIPLTNAYFDEVSFAATYSDHVPFFSIPLVLCLVWPLVLSCPKSHIPFIFASHSVYFAENCGCYGKNDKQIFFQNSDTIMLL